MGTILIVALVACDRRSHAEGQVRPLEAAEVPAGDPLRVGGIPYDVLKARSAPGAADPAKDAKLAASRDQFGMILFGMHPGSPLPVGVTCFTPYLQAPAVAAEVLTSDVATVENGRIATYGRTYNRTLADHPAFPYADLCRLEDAADSALRGKGGLLAVGQAARAVDRAPASLHEAARRGGPADLTRHLKAISVDTPDMFGMTALAWAVARDKPENVALLLRRGANPLAPGEGSLDATPILVAVTLGRAAILDQLLKELPQQGVVWPARYVEAALQSDQTGMVRRILSSPHEAPRTDRMERLEVSVPTAEALMEHHGKPAANALLIAGARNGRAELVNAALAGGADPDHQAERARALGYALEKFSEGHAEAAKLLIRAGADVNLDVRQGRYGTRPAWIAVQRGAIARRLGLDDYGLLRALLEAGADVRSSEVPGIPPVWTVLFSVRADPEEIDSAPPPEVLVLLARHGMDVNAPWKGRRVLDVVVDKRGPDSPLAKTLVTLGARRS